MMTVSSAILILLTHVGADKAAKPAPWNVDKAHSSVGFVVKHLGLSNVRGSFGEFDAKIMADPVTGKVTDVEATVQVKSVNTGIQKRDDHLKGDDFFSVEKFPIMKFKTKTVKVEGDHVVATADITLRDVTKTVTFTGEYLGTQKVNFGDGNQLRAGYSLKGEINRKDFGLLFAGVAEGVSVVSDKVIIELEMQISRKLS